MNPPLITSKQAFLDSMAKIYDTWQEHGVDVASGVMGGREGPEIAYSFTRVPEHIYNMMKQLGITEDSEGLTEGVEVYALEDKGDPTHRN